MSKYNVLLNILDELRNEAPKGYKRYYPSENEIDKLDQARSRAFIHLFLKVQFGLCDFIERENYITDDPYDGGIDAYYINKENKKITFIQSKFRTTKSNFENKEIDLVEILKMDVDRITDGERCDEEGHEYNPKIIKMMDIISKISDIGRYDYEVVILANLKKNYKESAVKKLTGGFKAIVFDNDLCYNKLVFPVVTGAYFEAGEIVINLSLLNKDNSDGKISYTVQTEHSSCKIMIVFVPLIEIAKIVVKYKNAILKYNPRCYLSLSNNNVNPKIENTVRKKRTNEFALFNNGITILSDKTEMNSKIAIKDTAQLIITNPQIINGGQTAYTLATVYEKCLIDNDMSVFEDKEVLVKVITIFNNDDDYNDQQHKLKLVEALSRATNEQSVVRELDRRSNDKVQINYQNKIFNDFGYFYNRKRGEFYDGLNRRYITRSKIIDTSVFVRIAFCIKGNVAMARRNGDEILFKEENFRSVVIDDDSYRSIMFGYFCHMYLTELEKSFERTRNNKFGISTYGNALRYGKYAVV